MLSGQVGRRFPEQTQLVAVLHEVFLLTQDACSLAPRHLGSAGESIPFGTGLGEHSLLVLVLSSMDFVLLHSEVSLVEEIYAVAQLTHQRPA